MGSSAISSRGRCASAAQRAIRCCSPPESSPGRAPARSRRPTRSSRLCARAGARAPAALEPERHPDQLLRSQLAGERPPVVLVGVAERSGPVVGQAPVGQGPELDTRDGDAAGARPLEPGKHAHQRGLPGPARAEDDADLALGDIEGQSLQRCDATVAPRIDAEQVAGLDEAHAPASCARAGPRSSRNALRVASATSAAATSR